MTEKQVNDYIDKYSVKFLERDENHIYMSAIKSNLNAGDYTIEAGINKKNEGINTLSKIELTEDDMNDIKDYTSHLNKDLSKSKENKNRFKKEITDVFVPVAIHNLKIRPLIAGSAINSEKSNSFSGTLGALFQIEGNNAIYFLTNYHNLSYDEPAKQGDLIFQPNNINSDFKNLIGHYVNGQYFNKKEGVTVNTTLDYAVVKLNVKALDNRLIPLNKPRNDDFKVYRLENHAFGFISNLERPFEEPYLKGIDNPVVGDRVSFHGSTTVISCKAAIKSIKTTIKVRDMYDENKVNIFKNQILIDKPCQNGDSGSVLVNSNKKIVGLIHASNLTSYSVANNINEIFCKSDCIECEDGKSCLKIKLKKILT